ncbi:MAG: hypothetical protein DRH32_07665 [Deltaproteobacteria bacterium]|nr:MAG: hypothetical protein DRH32_07665 [Deltaproteobacteria bacterium]
MLKQNKHPDSDTANIAVTSKFQLKAKTDTSDIQRFVKSFFMGPENSFLKMHIDISAYNYYKKSA